MRRAARRLTEAHRRGEEVVAVGSAQGQTTDEMIAWAAQVNPRPSRQELDAYLAAGEQMSASLMAMAIGALGGKAISGVAGRCQKLRVPAVVLAGRVALTPEQWAPLDLRAVRSINPAGATLEDARANAAAYYRTALETLLKEWK